MKHFYTLRALLMLTALSGCGDSRSSSSTLLERHDVPPTNIAAADVQTFLTHASSLAATTATPGSIPVIEFLRLMPLQENQRQILATAYPGTFDVSCSQGRCEATAHGSPAQATMNVVIDGLVNPTLVLGTTVTSNFVMRGNQAVEFCDSSGLSVRKFILTRPVQGLFLALDAGQPRLNVNMNDGRDNYTCN